MRHLYSTLTAIIMAASVVDAASAGTKYFRPTTSGNWSQDNVGAGTSIWFDAEFGGNQVSRPVDGDTAVVLSGKTCTVDVSNARADAFDVRGTGKLSISSNNQLEIDSNSSVAGPAGVVLAGSASVLKISSSLTMSGVGTLDGQHNAARIDLASGVTFTNTSTIEGNLQIVPASGASSTTFVNGSGGLVHANNPGTLDMSPDTIGTSSGTFQVSTSASAVLEFSTGTSTTALSGGFTVSNGQLYIPIDFNATYSEVRTSGTLAFTGGSIQLASGKSFKANH